MTKGKPLSERSSLTIQEVLDKMNHEFYAGLKCGRQESAEAVKNFMSEEWDLISSFLDEEISYILFVKKRKELHDKIFGRFNEGNHAQDITTGCLEELEDLEEKKGWGHQKRYEKKKGVYIERAGNITKDGFKAVQAICGTDERYSNYVKETTKEKKGCGKRFICKHPYCNFKTHKCGVRMYKQTLLCPECDQVGLPSSGVYENGVRREVGK